MYLVQLTASILLASLVHILLHLLCLGQLSTLRLLLLLVLIFVSLDILQDNLEV